MPSLQSLVAALSSEAEQCYGYPPADGVASFLGATLDVSLADDICCHNEVYAEPAGYLDDPAVDLFARLDRDAETTFYDSVCGLPLFVAPRGRSFDDFEAESRRHGWPSFRKEELVAENVIIHEGGRLESVCRTHLGHNLPDGAGYGAGDRYCIDLVCVAGAPLAPGDANYGILSLLNRTGAAGGIGAPATPAVGGYRTTLAYRSLRFRSEVAIGAFLVGAGLVLGVGSVLRRRRRENYEAVEIS